MSPVTCEIVVKEEVKLEHEDELIFPLESKQINDAIFNFAAAAKDKFSGTQTAIKQNLEWTIPEHKYTSHCLSSLETGQALQLSKFIKSSSLKNSINKRGAEWYGKHITPPKNFFVGWCDSRKAKAILHFLESFAGISRGSKYSRCANFSIACNGPRILVCEECLSQFGGLHDRYLKICRHYKTSHSRNCNKLIGRKLSQHHSTLVLMITAWQQDTNECLHH
ncbi:uncharacterized protein LOC117639641 isoform X2 [Thrips palmi]|uniref:Uncharacterized protein LOC117639641 isoform X2 n=1 Tax=Thrips palmi TaxID=161013 RepID=A0A6P8Y5Y1_THRPL|nr:uncharacterized protein LOC117639641 isoform X2 [Thrips palmi]